MLLLGSKSLCSYFEDIERFKKSDFDVVSSYDDFNIFISKNEKYIIKMVPISSNKFIIKLKKHDLINTYEIEIDFKESSKWLLKNKSSISEKLLVDDFNNIFIIPNIEILYLTKKSHINHNIHYSKNIKDYSLLKDYIKKDKLNNYIEYYNLRKKEVSERINRKNPKLSVSNEDFFNRSKNIVGYIFEHDDIHEAVKHFERPVYEMMKRDFSSAWCEKDMFEKLPHDYKIKCVQEEAYVIALERYIILQKGNYKDYKLSYIDALNKICTSLCSGFFRDFAVENYFQIINEYSSNYVEKFKTKLSEGLIKQLDNATSEKSYNILKNLNNINCRL